MCDVIVHSPVWDTCRILIEANLESCRRDLTPLESGEINVGERLGHGPWIDVTQGAIASCKRTITAYEAVLMALETH